MDAITFRRLGPDDLPLLLAVPEGVFDYPVDPVRAAAFLADPLHEMVVAFAGARAVGFSSGTFLLHPDKHPALFVNEVGVDEAFRQRGIATELCRALFAIARTRGTTEIWLGTEPENLPALALYRRLGGDEQHAVLFGWGGALDLPS